MLRRYLVILAALMERHEIEYPVAEMHGVQGHLPDAALDRDMFEGHVAFKFHIQTKGEPMDTVGSKCPKFFGRFGGASSVRKTALMPGAM
jgi:hypothetical protein